MIPAILSWPANQEIWFLVGWVLWQQVNGTSSTTFLPILITVLPLLITFPTPPHHQSLITLIRHHPSSSPSSPSFLSLSPFLLPLITLSSSPRPHSSFSSSPFHHFFLLLIFLSSCITYFPFLLLLFHFVIFCYSLSCYFTLFVFFIVFMFFVLFSLLEAAGIRGLYR